MRVENVEYVSRDRCGVVNGACTIGGFGRIMSCDLIIAASSMNEFNAVVSHQGYRTGSVHYLTAMNYSLVKNSLVCDEFVIEDVGIADTPTIASLFEDASRTDTFDKHYWTTGLDPQLTFENLHVDGNVGCNIAFPYAMGRAVAERPGQAYNPVLLLGASGQGKTTLLHAIGNAILTTQPDARVALISGEEFLGDTMLVHYFTFRRSYVSRLCEADVLLFDNLPDLAGNEVAQHEFFGVLSSLLKEGKQVVITSDLLPEKICGLDARIRRCLASCEIADFDRDNLRWREVDVATLAKRMDLNLHEDVVWLLAQHLRTLPEMERCCRWLSARSRLLGAKTGMDLAREYVRKFHPTGQAVSA
jgi:chromosomal replication initiation ATPase DnaA